MSDPAKLDIAGYEQLFSGFDTPLAHQIRQRRYLETVIELARRGAVARVMYLAQVKPRAVAQTPPTRD